MPIKFSHDKKLSFSPLGVGGILLIAYCLLPTLSCTAQEKSEVLKYARAVVDTLASPSMHGRGYVLKGDSIAADYIKGEFQMLGVKPIGNEFYQRFSFPVNTFPNVISLKINNVELKAGKDYIVSSYSIPSKGKSKIIYLNKSIIEQKKYHLTKSSRPSVLLDTSGFKKSDWEFVENINTDGNPIIYIEKHKLTKEISRNPDQSSTESYFTLFENSIPSNPETVFYNIETKWFPHYPSQNVIGYIKGTQYSDSFLVFTAHYDHLGMMGKDVYFPGANDNASGCAMLLSLARYYSQHPPKYSVAFMAFGGEEVGLLGSKYYIEHQLFNINQIKFLINFDIVGTGDEGIKVVNATEHKKEFDELMKINEEKKYLPSVQPRGKASISDHYFFEEAGVKTFYIYTLGGIKAYHDIYDRSETLPLTEFEELYKLVIDFENRLEK